MIGKSNSLTLAIIFTALFAGVLAVLTFAGPWIVRGMCVLFHREYLEQFLVIVTYAAVPAGWGAIYCLFRLLFNIRKETVFDVKNVTLLNVLSLLCIYVGLISAAGAMKFVVFALISAAAFFVGLMVRVVSIIIAKAIEIKEENDMTI